MQDRVCENCGRWIEPNEVLYRMTIIMEAEPGPELVLEEPDSEADLLAEIEKLVKQMENMSDEQVNEATDQVHEEYAFALCSDCRKIMHKRLARRRGFLETD
jgi:hypothetical protein